MKRHVDHGAGKEIKLHDKKCMNEPSKYHESNQNSEKLCFCWWVNSVKIKNNYEKAVVKTGFFFLSSDNSEANNEMGNFD